jgi:hypothetical protein
MSYFAYRQVYRAAVFPHSSYWLWLGTLKGCLKVSISRTYIFQWRPPCDSA